MAKSIDVNDVPDDLMRDVVEKSRATAKENTDGVEIAILSSMLKDGSAFSEGAARLSKGDFSNPVFSQMFVLFVTLSTRLDYVTAKAELEREKLWEAKNTLELVVKEFSNPANIIQYCQELIQASTKRELGRVSLQASESLKFGLPPAEVLKELASSCDVLHQRLLGGGGHDPKDLAEYGEKEAREAADRPARKFWGGPTGFDEFDCISGGIQSGEYWVVTAKTGIGKSLFTLQLAAGLCRFDANSGVPLIISTEMSGPSLGKRYLSLISGISLSKIMRGELCEEERKLLKEIQLPRGVRTVYMAGKSPEAVLAVARQHKREHGLPLLIVDLIDGLSSGSGVSDFERLSLSSNCLAGMKESLGCCIIGTVQQNRFSYQEDLDQHPERMMSGIKGTGAFAENADMVIGMVRNKSGQTEIHILKDRDPGWTGKCTLDYIPGVGYTNGTCGANVGGKKNVATDLF